MAPRFRPPGSDAMPDRLLGIVGHKALQLSLGLFVLEIGRPRPREGCREFGPCVRRTHVDDPYGLNARLRRLYPEQARRLTTFDAAPELALGGHDEVLVKRISMG